jgi:Tol biopolymer transport system component
MRMQGIILILILILTSSCRIKSNSSGTPLAPQLPSQLKSRGIEEVLKEEDGDILEFDVSADASKIAYSTNAYKNLLQVMVYDFKSNKKQYILPEETEQYSPRLFENTLYFIKRKEQTSYIVAYDFNENTTNTILKINSAALILTVGKNGFAFSAKQEDKWKIWHVLEGKLTFIDDGFYPAMANDFIYYQKENQKGTRFYAIYSYNIDTSAKFTILNSKNNAYLYPAVDKNNELLAFVEFVPQNSTYYLKLYNLKSKSYFTLLESFSPILAPNLNVANYIYFISKNEKNFSIYRMKIK